LISGDDPAYGVVKTLDVRLTLNGAPEHLSAHDGDSIDFSDMGIDRPLSQRLTSLPNGRLMLEAWGKGVFEVRTRSGRSAVCRVGDALAPSPVSGPWQVSFASSGRRPLSASFAALTSWSDSADAEIRYFSGAGTYKTTVQIPANWLAPGRRVGLDLGDVQVNARVAVNGRDLGIWWKAPYRGDITPNLKPGPNLLTVQVVNLWVNRQIGDEQLPDDTRRGQDGNLEAWPQWLAQDQPDPTGRRTFTTWKLWSKDSPLQPSGLLGPVTLVPSVVVALHPR
jgi:hypothetical protein